MIRSREPTCPGERIGDFLEAQSQKELFERAQADPQSVTPRLRDLVERHPGVPVLYNWLSVAYTAAKDDDSARRIDALLYERHPQYLFARLNAASRALATGDLASFEQIFEKKFDLKLLYPWRSVFHLSKFLAFSGVMIGYFVRSERDEPAEVLLGAMEEIAPDAPQTVHCREVLQHVGLLNLLKEAIGRLANPRRRRRSRSRIINPLPTSTAETKHPA